MANVVKTIDKAKTEAFAHRVIDDVGTALLGALGYIGDRVGLFKSMAASGPVTLGELTAITGLNERYLKEWLGAMVAAHYIEYEPATEKYLLPPEHAAVLADEESPAFLAGFIEEIVPVVTVAPLVAKAFREGGGVPQSAYAPEAFEAIERATLPWYKHMLVQEWLPTMPDVVAKLAAGGTCLDVGCGSGRAAIAIARAFPKAAVSGYDFHEGSIARARENARKEGVADRIDFQVYDCDKLPERSFDFITTFDVIHDSIDPVALMSSIRGALKPGGTYLMLEMNGAPTVEGNITPMGKLLYCISTLYCMTTSLAEGGAGLGAVMSEMTARELSTRAGFQQFNKLPVDDPFSCLYELKS